MSTTNSISSMININYINKYEDIDRVYIHFERAYEQIYLLEEEIEKLIFKLNSFKQYDTLQDSYRLRLIILEGVKSRFKYYANLCVERMKELQNYSIIDVEIIYV